MSLPQKHNVDVNGLLTESQKNTINLCKGGMLLGFANFVTFYRNFKLTAAPPPKFSYKLDSTVVSFMQEHLIRFSINIIDGPTNSSIELALDWDDKTQNVHNYEEQMSNIVRVMENYLFKECSLEKAPSLENQDKQLSEDSKIKAALDALKISTKENQPSPDTVTKTASTYKDENRFFSKLNSNTLKIQESPKINNRL